ncbi:unnamed protein product [Trypanosoma congolense IL3000]|uniref:WGS project CAEQ00000000 data, annotated contig 1826 n=1 Tax=Trypanosoma congolense (strain IL3000) TaxID=1068625 RepID=F9W960_TRYCI|nr:unnamed protein product [Trypanosoma congolense IL3000]
MVSVASAVLELLVEASPQRISVIVCALCNCCASAGDLLSLLQSARWRAWSTALRCCCRVCEEKKMSLVDSVPEVQSRLLPLFAELLCEDTMLSSAVELVDLLSLTLVGTTQTQLCTAFLSLLDGRFLCCGASCKDGDANEKGSHRLSGQSKLLSISVYAVHRLLSRCDGSIVEAVVAACDVCLWLQRSLFVLASGGPLAVYCGAYAVRTLLSIAPRIASHFPSLAVAAMDSACRHCALPDGSTLVARLLACLCDHEESECTLASELLARFISQCRQASPRRALLLRSISDNTLGFSRLCLRKQKEFAQNENVHMCQRCTLPRLTQCLPVVTLFTADDAPHDEATTRLLSHCLAASASVLVSRDVIVSDVFDSVGSALTALFRSSVGERHCSSTLSTIVAAMSVVALGCPALLDGTGMTGVVLSLFTDGFDPCKGKGVNYVGYCLLPALSCIRNPRQLDGIAAGMAGAPPASDGAPLSVAWPVVLGLWSSVAPFADHFVSLYFLAAWFRLLRYAMSVRSSGVGGFDPITVTASSCCVYALPSLHIKSLPRRRLEGCSIVQCIAVGLSLVLHKGRSVSKPQLLDTEIQDLHCITRRFEALCGGDVDSVGVDLFSTMSVSEGADWLLEQLLAAGYTTEVGTALSFASKC